MKITAITTDLTGDSQFETLKVLEIEVSEGQVKLSKEVQCTSIFIHEFDEGFENDWHNPPKPQYVVILEGALQIQLKHTSANFQIGNVFFANDLSGSGHRTIALKKGKCLVINLGE